MSYVIIVVTTLLLALKISWAQNCQPLNVGCCISIETDFYRRSTWILYDRHEKRDHWTYLDNKKQANRSHQWKVIAKKGNVFQFESVAFPRRCLCEKKSFLGMYGSSCDCKANEPVQLWELEGIERSNRVTFKRPGYPWYMYPCKNHLCLQIDRRSFQWLVKPC